MLSPARSRCSMPSIVRRRSPRSIARYSREPGACAANSPASTPPGMVVRMSSNSTPGRTGERMRRSQPEGSCAVSCSPRRSTTTRVARSSPSRRAMLVSSPVAMRSSTRTVGTLLPRSTSESMLRLTPVRASRSWSESRRRRRSIRRRAPSPAMSSPDDSRGPRPAEVSTIEDIILYGRNPATRRTGVKLRNREERPSDPDGSESGGRRSPPGCSTDLAELLEPGGADPARLRDVDRHSVGAAVLHLDVGIPMAGVADAKGLVDVVTGRRTGGLQPLGDRLQAFDLKADMMDAAPVLAALDACHRIVLEVEDRQIEVAVAQVVAPGVRAVDLRDLLHAEHLDVELGRLVHILGREGDVLDLRHGVSPVTVVRVDPFACPGRLRQRRPKRQDNHGGSSGRQEVSLLEFVEEPPDVGEWSDERLARDGHIDVPRRRRTLGHQARGAEALDQTDQSPGARVENAPTAHAIAHGCVDDERGGGGRIAGALEADLAHDAARQHDVAARREPDDPDGLAEDRSRGQRHSVALIALGAQERQVDAVVAGGNEQCACLLAGAPMTTEDRVDLHFARKPREGVPASENETGGTHTSSARGDGHAGSALDATPLALFDDDLHCGRQDLLEHLLTARPP